jgi:hypothetical protein
VFTMSKTRLVLVGCSLSLLLSGCSPPHEATLKECRVAAAQRGAGKNLSPEDLGELTEACMAAKGFLLNRDSKQCGHNRASETAGRCYYPNTIFGRVAHAFSHLLPQ